MFVEIGLLPALALIALGALVAMRSLGRRRSAIACAFALAAAADALLWCWATTPPVGPLAWLTWLMILIHAVFALVLIVRTTGLQLRSCRGVSGRYQRISSGRGGYNGFRGD